MVNPVDNILEFFNKKRLEVFDKLMINKNYIESTDDKENKENDSISSNDSQIPEITTIKKECYSMNFQSETL